jgi:hypothetical protein
VNELATEDHRRSESGVEQGVEELDSDDVSDDEEEGRIKWNLRGFSRTGRPVQRHRVSSISTEKFSGV